MGAVAPRVGESTSLAASPTRIRSSSNHQLQHRTETKNASDAAEHPGFRLDRKFTAAGHTMVGLNRRSRLVWLLGLVASTALWLAISAYVHQTQNAVQVPTAIASMALSLRGASSALGRIADQGLDGTVSPAALLHPHPTTHVYGGRGHGGGRGNVNR